MVVHLSGASWTMIVHLAVPRFVAVPRARQRSGGKAAFAHTATGAIGRGGVGDGFARKIRIPMVAHDGSGLPGHAIAMRDRPLGQNRATTRGADAGVGLHRATVDLHAGTRRA